MTEASRIISTMKDMGYDLAIDGDDICFHFHGEQEPHRGQVIPLLSSLKSHKAEVMMILRQQKARPPSLEDIMTAILNGTRDEIQRGGKWHFSPAVQEAEGGITATWQAVLQGKAALADFRAACHRWNTAGTV